GSLSICTFTKKAFMASDWVPTSGIQRNDIPGPATWRFGSKCRGGPSEASQHRTCRKSQGISLPTQLFPITYFLLSPPAAVADVPGSRHHRIRLGYNHRSALVRFRAKYPPVQTWLSGLVTGHPGVLPSGRGDGRTRVGHDLWQQKRWLHLRCCARALREKPISR